MRVLITGGAGYIGTELVKALATQDDVEEIVVFDNLRKEQYNLFTHSNIARGKIRFFRNEMLDSRTLAVALKGIDVVYHLAAYVDAKQVNANHQLYEQINNWGTAELSYAIEDAEVQRVINAGSAAVYGNQDTIIAKGTEPNPKTYYGTSKLRGEEHIKRLKDHLEVYNLRIGNVYGYGTSLRMDTFINRFVFNTAFENRIKILGTGEQKRPIIHIDSLTEILCQLRQADLDTGTYHVLEDNSSVLDIADHLKILVPDLEMLFVNQHLQLRNLELEADSRINALIKTDRSDVRACLKHFLEHLYTSA